MIAAVHALTGAALARLCRRPAQAFLVGALSHMLADTLPHRDLDLPEEALMLAAALGFVAATHGTNSRAFAGALGGVAPDVENLLGRLAGVGDEKMLLPSHRNHHGRETDSLLPQVALAVGCLALLAIPDTNCDKAGPPRGICG